MSQPKKSPVHSGAFRVCVFDSRAPRHLGIVVMTSQLLISALASAYLAYFGISSEQQLNDPRNTGGIFTQ